MERKELAAVALMRALVAAKAANPPLQAPLASQDTSNTSVAASTMDTPIRDFSYRVDGKGTVLFTLANGGRVLDTGDSVHFSVNDQAAEVAKRLARIKWGAMTVAIGSSVRFSRDGLETTHGADMLPGI